MLCLFSYIITNTWYNLAGIRQTLVSPSSTCKTAVKKCSKRWNVRKLWMPWLFIWGSTWVWNGDGKSSSLLNNWFPGWRNLHAKLCCLSWSRKAVLQCTTKNSAWGRCIQFSKPCLCVSFSHHRRYMTLVRWIWVRNLLWWACISTWSKKNNLFSPFGDINLEVHVYSS